MDKDHQKKTSSEKKVPEKLSRQENLRRRGSSYLEAQMSFGFFLFFLTFGPALVCVLLFTESKHCGGFRPCDSKQIFIQEPDISKYICGKDKYCYRVAAIGSYDSGQKECYILLSENEPESSINQTINAYLFQNHDMLIDEDTKDSKGRDRCYFFDNSVSKGLLAGIILFVIGPGVCLLGVIFWSLLMVFGTLAIKLIELCEKIKRVNKQKPNKNYKLFDNSDEDTDSGIIQFV